MLVLVPPLGGWRTCCSFRVSPLSTDRHAALNSHLYLHYRSRLTFLHRLWLAHPRHISFALARSSRVSHVDFKLSFPLATRHLASSCRTEASVFRLSMSRSLSASKIMIIRMNRRERRRLAFKCRRGLPSPCLSWPRARRWRLGVVERGWRGRRRRVAHRYQSPRNRRAIE